MRFSAIGSGGGRAVLGALLAIYPFIVYFGLLHAGTRVTAAALLLVLLARFAGMPGGALLTGPLAALLAVNYALALLLNDSTLVLLSPVFMNLSFLILFGTSLFQERSFVERIAAAMDPALPAEALPYCRRVTKVWCLFFAVNGTVALWTACATSLEVWTFYNGFLAYLLMGGVMASEYAVRKWRMAQHRAAGRAARSLVIALACAGLLADAADSRALPENAMAAFTGRPVPASSTQSVLKEIGAPEVMRGSFTQERTVQGMLRPLQSSGKFLFSRNAGLRWEIEKPFPSTFMVTPKGVRRETPGEPPVFLEAGRDPAVRGVSEIFLGLFGSKPEVLPEVFELYWSPGPPAWHLGLVPHSSRVRSFLSRVVLRGSKQLEDIWIEEGSDEAHITLTHSAGSAAPLTADEEKLFE